MDISRLLDVSSPLVVVCPHCGHSEVDELEVVESGGLQEMRCVACGAEYHCVVMECQHCGAECFFSRGRETSRAVVDNLSCPACGWSYVEHAVPHLEPHLHA